MTTINVISTPVMVRLPAQAARPGGPPHTAPAPAAPTPGLAHPDGRGGQPVTLPAELESAHAASRAALAEARLSAEPRRPSASKTRQSLAWLHTAGLDGQPL